MKKFLLLLLISNLVAAQNADLLNTDWKITKIFTETNGDIFPPAIQTSNLTSFSADSFNSSFFNSVGGGLTYSGQDSFKVNNKACTLADYWGDNGEVNQFFDTLCDFFNPQNNFYYYIQTNGAEKTLVIENSIFENIYFTNGNLATKGNNISQFILGPNPVKNSLNIQNSEGINSAEIFDTSGKLVYKMEKQSAKNVNIDTHNLKTGTYFIKLNNEKTYKIIKE